MNESEFTSNEPVSAAGSARRYALIATAAVALFGGIVFLIIRTSRTSPAQSADARSSKHGFRGARPAQAPPEAPLETQGALPATYRTLLSRSVFARGPAGAHFAGPAPGTIAAPGTLTLKGISQEDSRFTGFLEDATAGNIVEVRVGDVLSFGRIEDISLEHLQYEAAGHVIRVEVGQSIDASATSPSGSDAAVDTAPAIPPRPG